MNRVIIYIIGIVTCAASCSPKNISSKYYYEHETDLDRIEQRYKELYSVKPFTVAFTDRNFSSIAVEFITDTMSYIYEFGVNEPRLRDSLVRFRMQPDKILSLVNDMQKVRCTWINNFDYYVDDKERRLIFISIKPVAIRYPFTPAKYYILAYFFQPQSFDSQGRLLDKRRLKRLRKINGQVFMRINDKVCYTVAEKFR